MKIRFISAAAALSVVTTVSLIPSISVASEWASCRIVWKSGNVMSPTFSKGKWKTPRHRGKASLTAKGIRMNGKGKTPWIRYLTDGGKILDENDKYAGKYARCSYSKVKKAIQ